MNFMSRDSCPKFIALSFAVRTGAHLAHLSSKSYAEHVALGEFYEALPELVDQYAEVYMGLYGSVSYASWPTPPAVAFGDPAQALQQYLEAVKDEQVEDDAQSLLNILAEIEALVARTVYKLVNLK